MLRQAKNQVRIEGILSEIALKYGSFVNKKTGATVDNIGGYIKVLVNQTINGEDNTLDIPVYMFASKYTNAGKLNPAYESIEQVMTTFTSIAAAGNTAQADKIRITNGNIRMNEYYNAQGQLISYPRVNASFVSKATGEFVPEASFGLEFAVSSMDFVTDEEGVEVEPKKLRIKAIVPQYGGKVDTIEMFATNPKVIDAITTYWEKNKTYSAKGRLNFSTTTVKVITDYDFGESDVSVRTQSVSELIVTKGTQAPMEDEQAFDPVELKAALDEHKAELEAMKDRAVTKQTPAPINSASKPNIDLGF